MDTKHFEEPTPSALSELIKKSKIHGSDPNRSTLPIEVLYNLKYQHAWTELSLHTLSSRSHVKELELSPDPPSNSPIALGSVTLISGLPPRHSYIHPDVQSHLIKHKISESNVQIQREWVLPVSLGEKLTLNSFSTVFDALPQREMVQTTESSKDQDAASPVTFKWRDSKRILLGMLAYKGMGGDGTVVYYIMQEGEVKPRQHG